MISYLLLNILVVLATVSGKCQKGEKYASGNNTDMDAALKFIDDFENQALPVYYKKQLAEFDNGVDLTPEHQKAFLESAKSTADFDKKMYEKATKFAWKNLKDQNETAYRVFKAIATLNEAILPSDKLYEFGRLIAEMGETHSQAKICKYPEGVPCNIPFEPNGMITLATSNDFEELTYVWDQYHNGTGKQFKDKFIKYVELINEAACLNGFNDAGELWREEFEDNNIVDEFIELWDEIKPMYEQLHAYLRSKLIKIFPKHIKEDGPIPANILGEVMGATWLYKYVLVRPYYKDIFDVSDAMKEQNVTIMGMVHMAEDFFKSLGMLPMSDKFWKYSVFQKPEGNKMVCHPEAQDLYIDDDVRIKMCVDGVDMSSFETLHHEMGHCEYFLQYKNQPLKLRTGANSGFHEAVGDTIALSVTDPAHYKRIGLIDEIDDDPEKDLNNLMKIALGKIATVPYTLIGDLWRWQVFDGSIPINEMNKGWWEIRLKYQGMCPPNLRTEEDFDAGGIHHVATNTPFIRYFIAYVIQFQFHKALCDEAGYTGPLHKCDIYNSKEAGKILGDMLKLGASRSWREALKVLTKGKTDKIEAAPILEYFKPLVDWLKEQNKNNYIGWKSDNPMLCPDVNA